MEHSFSKGNNTGDNSEELTRAEKVTSSNIASSSTLQNIKLTRTSQHEASSRSSASLSENVGGRFGINVYVE